MVDYQTVVRHFDRIAKQLIQDHPEIVIIGPEVKPGTKEAFITVGVFHIDDSNPIPTSVPVGGKSKKTIEIVVSVTDPIIAEN